VALHDDAPDIERIALMKDGRVTFRLETPRRSGPPPGVEHWSMWNATAATSSRSGNHQP